MPKIVIRNLSNREVPFLPFHKSILHAIQDEYIDWMHTCGGKGRCTSCKMNIIEGMTFISQDSENEERFRRLNKLNENERLACQCEIAGDILIEVPEENKLPHLNYT